MARLEIEHVTGTPLAAVGEMFTVSLLPGPNTEFLDENSDSVNLFSSSSGTVLITSAAAVPEPASTSVLLVGSVAGLWWKRRKLRQPEASHGLFPRSL
jgi:hypothetical protein